MSPELPFIMPLLSLSHRLAAFPADSKVGHAGTIGHSSSDDEWAPRMFQALFRCEGATAAEFPP